MKKINYPSVLTIAGTDPSGGAGIQADIKVISATGCYAASVITALVAQNTQGVQAIEEVSPNFVKKQLESVFSDLTINAVKIGMLHNENIMEIVSHALAVYKPKQVVLDPVMFAKSGHCLLNANSILFLKNTLFPLVSLITPNLPEAECIAEVNITSIDEMANAARMIGKQHKVNVLIKGGHMNNKLSSDVLYSFINNKLTWFHADRIHTNNTHGTGCSLSSAIASFLAQGYNVIDAISMAKNYLTKAIQSGSQFTIGRGCGPIDHFYYLR